MAEATAVSVSNRPQDGASYRAGAPERIGAGSASSAQAARLFPSRPFVGASVAVFRGSRVLLARRKGGAGAGLLSLPGGLIELGESAEEAALRELREEVNVEARIVGLAGHVDVIDRDAQGIRQHYVVLAFAAQWLAGEGEVSAEAGEIIWAESSALGGLGLSKGLPGLIRKARHLCEGA